MGSWNEMTALVDHPDASAPEEGRVPRVQRDGPITRAAAFVLAGSGLAVAAVLRVWVIGQVTVPAIVPDEIGTWSIARYLAGVQPPLPMRDAPVYAMGTGLLLTPIVRLFSGTVAPYRAALVLLGVVMLVAALLVTAFVRGLGFRRPEHAAMCFVLVLLFPATTLTSMYTWSEALALAALAGLLVLTQQAFLRTTTSAFVAAAACAAALPFVHARFTLVPFVWLACTIPYIATTDAWPRPRRVKVAVALAMVVGVLYAGATVVYRRAVDVLWADPSPASPGLMHTVLSPGRWPQLLGQLAGEAWYAIAASFGLAAPGAVWIGRSLTRRRELSRATRATLITTIAVFASVVAASVAIVANGIIQRRGRPLGRLDYYFHGRYVDGVVLVLAAIGLSCLLTEDGRRLAPRLALLVAGSFAVLTAFVVGQLPARVHGFFGPSIAGVYFVPFVHGLHLLFWSVLAMAIFAAIVVLTRVRSAVSLAVIAALLGFASWGAASNAVRDHGYWARLPLYAAVPAPSAARDRVVIAADVAARRSYGLYAFTQAYALTGKGWTVEFSSLDSAALAADPGRRTGVIVVLRSQPVRDPDWGVAGQEVGASVWFRAR
jgi:hypothetical protein